MPFNFNNMPDKKPSGFEDVVLEDGIHDAVIEKLEYKNSAQGNPMLSITLKSVPEGKFIWDQIMDDQTKQINLYKLGKLLAAVGITPQGNLELRDIPRILKKGMALQVATITNAKGYVNVDINKHDGYYPVPTDAVSSKPTPKTTPDTQTPTIKPADDDSY